MPRIGLLLAAGGAGLRLGGGAAGAEPKQLRLLAGRPVLLRALDPFIGLVDEVVVAAPAAHRQHIANLLAQACPSVQVQVVQGGATRQASVLAALRACTAERILVHDAARPFTPRACITACLAALERHPAALVALPCRDTVKMAELDAPRVASTLPRERLHLAQTPQGFHRAAGLAALEQAEREGWTCTDEAQACERAGLSVALVEGSPRNFKLTTADDWMLAEAVLASARASSPPAAPPAP